MAVLAVGSHNGSGGSSYHGGIMEKGIDFLSKPPHLL